MIWPRSSTMRGLLPMLVLVAYGSLSAAPPDEWPRVREFQASFGIDATSERTLLVLPIYNYSNQEQYRLVCIGGNTEYLDRLYPETNAHFVGPLQCNLLDQPEIYNEHTLLGEDGSPAWHTRGRFSWTNSWATVATIPSSVACATSDCAVSSSPSRWKTSSCRATGWSTSSSTFRFAKTAPSAQVGRSSLDTSTLTAIAGWLSRATSDACAEIPTPSRGWSAPTHSSLNGVPASPPNVREAARFPRHIC